VIAVLGEAAGLGYRLFKSSLTRFSEEKIKTLQAILNTACEELNDKTGFVFR